MTGEELIARVKARRAQFRRQLDEQAASASRAQREAAADLERAVWGTTEEKRDILPRLVARVESERDEQRQPQPPGEAGADA